MSYIHEHSEAMSSIAQVREELRHLSNAFSTVGNEDIAYRLRAMVITLSDAQSTCQDIFDRQITEHYNDARQASSNMLAAALAVATKGGKHGTP